VGNDECSEDREDKGDDVIRFDEEVDKERVQNPNNSESPTNQFSNRFLTVREELENIQSQ